jgi:uncharacterized protein YjbI with pentapeptide repeats
MPSHPTPTTRRRFLASFLSLVAAPAEGFSLFGKKRARDLGKVYKYLQDGFLRVKEIGEQRITIENAIFSGEDFNGSSWGYCDFVDCEFTGQYKIRLDWLVNCTFTDCHFNGIFYFGGAYNTKFLRCSAKGESILSMAEDSRNMVFEKCSFVNTLRDRNHVGGILCHGEILFIDCKAEGFALKGSKKLTLRHCTTISAELDTAASGLYRDKSQMPYSDFLLENCDFSRGVEMSNAKLNSFTIRNCKLGVFEPFRPVIRDFALIEGIREGNLDLSSSRVHGKLTVKNCSFFKPHDGHSFWCPGVHAEHTLIENVVCGSHPVNISGLPIEMTEEERLPKTLNKSFIIRGCNIPHLHVDWAQTEHLRLENCTIDTLLIRNGRIGKLEIIDCSLKKLDVSNTQVQEQDVRVPKGCDTLATDSNIKLLPRE